MKPKAERLTPRVSPAILGSLWRRAQRQADQRRLPPAALDDADTVWALVSIDLHAEEAARVAELIADLERKWGRKAA